MIKYGFKRSYLNEFAGFYGRRRMNESAGFYGRNLNSRDESYEVDVYLCKLLAKKEKCNWKEVQLVSDNHRVPGYEMFNTIDKSMSDRRCISKPIDVLDYDDPDDPGYRATLIQNSEGCYTIRLYDEYSKVTTYFINPDTWY